MASETANPRRANRDRIAYAAFGGLAAVAVGIVLYGLLSRPPQMGASEEVFHTVDALYTAVRSHDEKRVSECERRLHGSRASGELPAAAADSLDGIIRKARSGGWETATERLYEFMLAQRRDGANGQHHEVKPKATPSNKAKR